MRDYLRDQKRLATEADLRMNLLAETGPQNLEQAWVYFKHWVKGRPVGPEICMTERLGIPGEFGDGSMMPDGMKGWREGKIETLSEREGKNKTLSEPEERNTEYNPLLNVSKPTRAVEMEFDVTSPDPASSASDELLTRDPFWTPYRPYMENLDSPLLSSTLSYWDPLMTSLNEAEQNFTNVTHGDVIKALGEIMAEQNFTDVTQANILSQPRERRQARLYNASA